MPREIHPAFTELADVYEFQAKFNVPMATQPEFLDPDTMEFRMQFLQEELDELDVAFEKRDLEKVIDALIDLEYVLKGTILMMGLAEKWPELWAEVHRANMTKVRAAHAGESKRKNALDVIKPPGWQPPNLRKVLNPPICAECGSLMHHVSDCPERS